uniref:J domain-containing protein n=1 Tax=Steinernema glaseri TaxID=37863 RepID=A0A1I8A8S4_9BILA
MKFFPLISGLCLVALILAEPDPYKVLGVGRSASIRDIKRAYKTLAKEWHPDKNDSPDAKEKFIAMSNAYELLSDPVRRERYDKFGTVDEEKRRHNYHAYQDFFHGFGGFGGFETENSYFRKDRLTYNTYINSVLEKTYTQPFIILVYSSFSPFAFRQENVWKTAVEDLRPLGYGVGTVNAVYEGNLLDTLRCHSNFALLVVVEGRVLHYRGNLMSMKAHDIRVFARDAIPKTFLSTLSSNDGLIRFVDQWKSSNKISVLMMGPKAQPRVRYLLAAMKYSHFARFAYVHSVEGSSREMKQALGVQCTHCDNMFIFNDYPEGGPVDRITKPTGADMFTVEEILNFIEKNLFLSVPKLSSMHYFDELCPTSGRGAKKLCVMLPVSDSTKDETYEKFMEPLMKSASHEQKANHKDLLVIWRVDHNVMKFTWLKAIVNGEESKFYLMMQDLNKALENILQGNIPMNHHATIHKLIDEYSPSFFTRMSHRAVRIIETVLFNMHKTEVLTALSIIGTMIAIFVFPYLGHLLTRPPTKPHKSNVNADGAEWHPEDPVNEKSMLSKSDLKLKAMSKLIRELRAETYYGLIRLLKPGCRTFVILVDSETKDILLPTFANHMWSLRNNKTFSFAYLMVDKNLPWFRKLLENILPADSTDPNSETDVSQQMYKRLQKPQPLPNNQTF